MRPLVVLLVVAIGCASSAPALDKATIGRLTFGAPSGWEAHDLSNPQRAMWQWIPGDHDNNEGKESLVVIRSDRPTMAKATTSQLQRLLREAQPHESTFATPSSFTTRHGYRGVRIEGEFSAATARYRRIHAVFVDGTATVNVIYTARVLDRERFDAVLDSFYREEA